ncbi:MAG TPA: sigma-70 family RNA polymerase sigma factor [Kofleriaceae bacterium]|nr:sigma-70 family RNA polymerase sigma factor [Kofleriaceae bacterium]
MGDGIDAEVEALVQAGELDKAATRLMETYGSEIYGFLMNLMSNETAAADVFSQFGEDLWAGLSKFKFKSSLRTWLYVLARHAGARYRRTPWNKSDRRGNESRIQSMVDIARSRTQPWQRTEIKDGFSAIRESLDPDDRILLTLRVDRDLPWDEVARVMLDGEDADEIALKKECDRLRKRFQLLKTELRKRAQEAGLLDAR